MLQCCPLALPPPVWSRSSFSEFVRRMLSFSHGTPNSSARSPCSHAHSCSSELSVKPTSAFSLLESSECAPPEGSWSLVGWLSAAGEGKQVKHWAEGRPQHWVLQHGGIESLSACSQPLLDPSAYSQPSLDPSERSQSSLDAFSAGTVPS